MIKQSKSLVSRVALFTCGFASALGSALTMMPEGTAYLVGDFDKIPLTAWLFALVAGLSGGASPDSANKPIKQPSD